MFITQKELRDREHRLQLQQELLWKQQEHQLDVMRQYLLTQKDHTEALQKEADDKEANRRAEKREEKLDRVRTSLIPMSASEDLFRSYEV